MAELILTDKEKAAALWSDLDDAALGKLVKRKIAIITGAAAQLDQATTFAAALMLCLDAAHANATETVFEIDGLTHGEIEIGNWRVAATKMTTNAGGNATERSEGRVDHNAGRLRSTVGKDEKSNDTHSESTGETCNYPHCTCPFDAPADPKWCARGLPHNA